MLIFCLYNEVMYFLLSSFFLKPSSGQLSQPVPFWHHFPHSTLALQAMLPYLLQLLRHWNDSSSPAGPVWRSRAPDFESWRIKIKMVHFPGFPRELTALPIHSGLPHSWDRSSSSANHTHTISLLCWSKPDLGGIAKQKEFASIKTKVLGEKRCGIFCRE